ncbi:MAG: SPASM domain-containing protein [Cyclobacteriaceae bacterium]
MNASYRDAANLISKLTIKKIVNALTVLFTYLWSKNFKKFASPALPFSMAIEPTTSCNLRCPECPSGLRSFTRPTGMLDTKLFEQTIEQVKEHLIYLTFYFQGEPYLHADFLDMVKYASKQGIYTATSTNAHYLDHENARKTVESGLDRLIISIDGTSQESYESYRIGGDLEKVIEGTKNVVKSKKELKSAKPHVVFQFLVLRQNEHQIEEVERLAKEIGVDEIAFKTAQIYDYENGSPLIPENEKYSRYRNESSGKYHLKNPLHDHCWKMWHSCVITWDGKVVPCCFDKDASHVMGYLKKDPLSEIWENDSYVAFRKSILKSRSEIDICKNCSEGLEVFSG